MRGCLNCNQSKIKRKLPLICLLLMGALIFASSGCEAKKAAEEGKKVSHLQGVVVAGKVSKLPEIDGDGSDAVWKKASVLNLDGPADFKLKAVYTNKDLVLLASWKDARLSMNTADSWLRKDGRWVRTRYTTGDPKSWGSFLKTRYPEWFAIYWGKEIRTKDWLTEGCLVTCKRKKAGGQTAHGVKKLGTYCDTWMLLARHGYGPSFNIEQGWLAGDVTSSQTGPVVFDQRSKIETHSLSKGQVSFTGYAEDRYLTTEKDPAYPKMDTEDAKYCLKCHRRSEVEKMTLVGDSGGMKYYGNRNVDSPNPTAPKYIEKNPTDFIDAMILTQKEVEQGEAVPVSILSEEQISEYWGNYQRLNAVVSQIVLKTPTGSQADIREGVTWKDGVWTVEVKRALDTGNSDDIQFTDLSKDYHFGLSLFSETDLGASWGTADLVLRFRQ